MPPLIRLRIQMRLLSPLTRPCARWSVRLEADIARNFFYFSTKDVTDVAAASLRKVLPPHQSHCVTRATMAIYDIGP